MSFVFYLIIENESWASLKALPGQLSLLEGALGRDELFQKNCAGEVAIKLSGDAEVAQLNTSYRGKPGSTDILSFPADRSYQFDDVKPLGDLILAYETCQKDAAEMSKDMTSHCLHLVIHGILHLLGYTHDNDEDFSIMRKEEVRLLALIGLEDPY